MERYIFLILELASESLQILLISQLPYGLHLLFFLLLCFSQHAYPVCMSSNVLLFDKVHLGCLQPSLVDFLQHLRFDPLQLTDPVLDQRGVELDPVSLYLRIPESRGHVDRALRGLCCSGGVWEPLVGARLGCLRLRPIHASQFFDTGAPLFSHS